MNKHQKHVVGILLLAISALFLNYRGNVRIKNMQTPNCKIIVEILILKGYNYLVNVVMVLLINDFCKMEVNSMESEPGGSSHIRHFQLFLGFICHAVNISLTL